jgi:hypothetical protein
LSFAAPLGRSRGRARARARARIRARARARVRARVRARARARVRARSPHLEQVEILAALRRPLEQLLGRWFGVG